LVNGLGFSRDEMSEQEEVFDTIPRHPYFPVRATLFAASRRTRAIWKRARSHILPVRASQIRLPACPCCLNREVDAVALQAPRLIREPVKMRSICREIGLRSGFADGEIGSRCCRRAEDLGRKRSRGATIPEPDFALVRKIVLRQR